jgi:fumarate reductase flavoprotein subunit
MDRLNLENLTLVSRAIAAAADFRHNSRGAHFREDHPRPGDLAASTFTKVRLDGDRPHVTAEAVRHTRVRPGESLLDQTPSPAQEQHTTA